VIRSRGHRMRRRPPAFSASFRKPLVANGLKIILAEIGGSGDACGSTTTASPQAGHVATAFRANSYTRDREGTATAQGIPNRKGDRAVFTRPGFPAPVREHCGVIRSRGHRMRRRPPAFSASFRKPLVANGLKIILAPRSGSVTARCSTRDVPDHKTIAPSGGW
jgi:hypothetical protein